MLSTHALVLAIMLFGLGLIGLLSRRNILYMLLSLEIMLNAAALAFIAGGARWGQVDGGRSCSCSSSLWQRQKSLWHWGSCCSCRTGSVHWTQMPSAR